MEEIQQLIAKAKKEEKKNPQFLYELGLRFKRGEGVEQSDKKAAKYFEKAADLGHREAQVETGLRWWKYWHSYYYANLYLQKAIAQGSEEAKTILQEMEEEKQAKKESKQAAKADCLIHCSNKKGAALYEVPKFRDSQYITFCKNHTLVRCPACRGEIGVIAKKKQGALTQMGCWVYDKGTPFEHRSEEVEEPTYAGETLTETYRCLSCCLTFDKITNKKYEVRDATPTWREVLTDSAWKTEWWSVVQISYKADPAKVGKDVLKVLKKSEGRFEGKDT